MNAWALKLCAACVLTLCCALGGRALALRQARRADALKAFLDALMALRRLMLDSRMPLPQALRDSGNAVMARVGAKMDGQRDAGGAWALAREELIRAGEPLDALEAGDLDCLNGFFEALGGGMSAAEAQKLDGALERVGDRQRLARGKADEQRKLYTSLGLMLGLAISIGLL